MSWEPYRGTFGTDWYSKTASQIFTYGAAVDVVDGLITVCTITRQSHSGVIMKTVVSTDSDYASETSSPIRTPGTPLSEWRVTVLSTDTAVATDVGNLFDIGGTPVGIDVTRATSNDDHFLVTQFISANVVVGRMNAFKGTTPGIGTAT